MRKCGQIISLLAMLGACSSATPNGTPAGPGGAAATDTNSAAGTTTQSSAGGTSGGAAGGSLSAAGGGQSGASNGASAGIFGSGAAASGAGAGGASGSDSGAGGALAGSAGAATNTSCAGLFCEDFESGQLDSAVWDTKTFGGQTVAVQSSIVAHGKYAVRFHATPNVVSYDFIIAKSAPAALQKHHFGRASFMVTPKPPAQHTAFVFAGTSGFPNFTYLEVAATGSTWQLSAVHLTVQSGKATSDSNGTQEVYHAGGTVPLARWACLEWEFNDEPDQATVFVDGQQDVAFTGIKLNDKSNGAIGNFTSFGFGFYAWHPATYEFDVYYDDIVLDTKRINCPPPS